MALGALTLAAVAGGLWVARGALAERALVGWLEREGVAADVRFERLELDGAVGRVRVGPADRPIATVEAVEVDYRVVAPWAGGLGVRPSRIRLVEPRLNAVWRDGRLSVGSLDPLIRRFADRPADPDGESPLILIERGEVVVATPYGSVRGRLDGRIEDGRLRRLSLTLPETSLRGPAGRLGLAGGRIGAARVNDRLAVRVLLDGLEAEGETGRLAAGDATLDLGLAYPGDGAPQFRGPAAFKARLQASRAAGGDAAVDGLVLDLTGDGRVSGPLEALRLEGRVDGSASGREARLGDLRLTEADLALNGGLTVATGEADGAAWRFDGPARLTAGAAALPALDGAGVRLRADALTLGGRGAAFEAAGPLNLAARRLSSGDLDLTGVAGSGGLDLIVQQDWVATVDLALTSSGAWKGFGPAAAADPPELRALKGALGDFALAAPGLRLTLGAPGFEARLTRPLAARPRSGGELIVGPAPIGLLFDDALNGGAFLVDAREGGGLPALDLSVPAWRLTPGGFTAELSGRGGLDFAPAEDLTIAGAGRLSVDAGRTTFSPSGCLDVAARRLELGENDAEAVSADLCARTGPLVTVANGGWILDGLARRAVARLPSFQAEVVGASGPISARGGPGLALDARIATAELRDLADPIRFRPVDAQGRAALDDERWTGAFDLIARTEDRPVLGRADLSHDGRTGVGALTLKAPNVALRENGLQPRDLTPIGADLIGPPVSGRAAFDGRFEWTPDGVSSGGTVDLIDLDFVSPAGPVEGLNGRIAFDSLAPLTTAPGQRLTARGVAAFAPLEALDLTFALEPDALLIEGGRFTAAGGVIRLEPLRAPLSPGAPISGVVAFEGVELGELLGALGLGQDIRIDARVSGRIPFTRLPDGRVRLQAGTLAAIEPGRLSIPRTALDEVSAGGGGEGASPNMVQDLAYQAMENLAFNALTADVSSTDDGRMNVRFHIMGRHDPPERQEIRLSIFDLIQRRFGDETLPLPSGTEIDLTLDLNFNAEQLFDDLLALDRARRGQVDP